MVLDPNMQWLNTGIHSVTNEQFIMPITDERVYLKHDNVENLTVFTGLNSTGQQITGFTLNQDEVRNYKYYVQFDLSTRSTYGGQTLYFNYTSTGDMVDDELIQGIYDEIVSLRQTVDSFTNGQSTLIKSTVPADEVPDYQGTIVVVNFNKWIDEGNESKLKVYSDVNRTQEVGGTVSKTGNKQLTWTAISSLNPSTMYYPKVLDGVLGVDGVAMTSEYTWEFQTAANQAPSVSVSVSGNTTIGSTLTATANVGSDPEGDTVQSTTWRWLRDDVAISGATANTYTIVEADIGKTLKAEATVTMNSGASPSPTTSSGTVIPVPVVTGVSATPGSGQVTVSWTNLSSFSTETYNIKRSTTSNGAYSTIATGQTGNNYVDNTVVNGTTYYYKVSVVVNGTEGSDSTATSGVTPSANTPPTATITVSNVSTTQMTVQGTVSGIGG